MKNTLWSIFIVWVIAMGIFFGIGVAGIYYHSLFHQILGFFLGFVFFGMNMRLIKDIRADYIWLKEFKERQKEWQKENLHHS